MYGSVLLMYGTFSNTIQRRKRLTSVSKLVHRAMRQYVIKWWNLQFLKPPLRSRNQAFIVLSSHSFISFTEGEKNMSTSNVKVNIAINKCRVWEERGEIIIIKIKKTLSDLWSKMNSNSFL